MLVIAAAITTTKGTVEIVFPPYLVAYGAPLSIVGALVSLVAVAQLASRVPVGLGYHADRGTRQFAVALVAFGLSTAGFALAAGQPAAVLALVAAHGLAFGAVGTLGLALAIDVTGGRSAGVSMAWYTAAISLGYALGSIIGGWLGGTIGYSATMGVIAGVPLLAALVVLSLPRIEGAAFVPDRGTGWRGLFAATRKLDSPVWVAVVSVVFINLIWDSLDTFFVIFAPTVGISLATVGLLRAVKSGTGLAIRVGGAVVLALADHRRVTLFGVAGATAMMVVLPLSTSLAILVLIFALLGIARGLIRATSAATIADLRREGRDVGLASGVYNAGLDIGSIAGPTLGGAIAGAVGIPAMFQVVSVVGFAAWLAVALSSRRTREAAGLGRSKVLPFAEHSVEAPLEGDLP